MHRIDRGSTGQNVCSSSPSSRLVCLISNHCPSVIISMNMTKPFHQGLLASADRSVCYWLEFSSYPYSEEHDEAHSYLRARCPAWCDRILLSHSFKSFIESEVLQSFSLWSPRLSFQTHRPTYNIMGRDVCVGDHKVCHRLTSSSQWCL